MTFKYLKNKIYVQTGIKPLDCYHIFRETQSKWKLCLDFYKCNSEMRELQRSINTYNVRYFPQHVLLCTTTVHDQSANICIQGYLRIL